MQKYFSITTKGNQPGKSRRKGIENLVMDWINYEPGTEMPLLKIFNDFFKLFLPKFVIIVNRYIPEFSRKDG